MSTGTRQHFLQVALALLLLNWVTACWCGESSLVHVLCHHCEPAQAEPGAVKGPCHAGAQNHDASHHHDLHTGNDESFLSPDVDDGLDPLAVVVLLPPPPPSVGLVTGVPVVALGDTPGDADALRLRDQRLLL